MVGGCTEISSYVAEVMGVFGKYLATGWLLWFWNILILTIAANFAKYKYQNLFELMSFATLL